MICFHVCLLDIILLIIEDDEWNRCKKMSVPCSDVVHEDRIKKITVDKCLTYADDTDAWTVNDRLDIVVFLTALRTRKGHIRADMGSGPER